MPITTIAFGIILAALCGAIYHFIRGGTSKKFASFLLLSLAGFWVGDALGETLGWTFGRVGLLNAGMGAIFSFVFIIIGDLLSIFVIRTKESS